MAKRNKRGRKPRDSRQPARAAPALASTVREKSRGIWTWLAGSGFVLAIASAAYEYLMGDLSLAYSKPLGKGYELILANDGPSDRVIDTFRITFPPGQTAIYTVTQETLVPAENGKAVFPGGVLTRVPAAEFKELDGHTIGAHAQVKFRIPPLTDRSWLLPQATLVSVRFSSLSANPLLRPVEEVLRRLHLVNQESASDFLVVDNYWSPVKSGSLKDAITQACREDETIAGADICRRR